MPSEPTATNALTSASLETMTPELLIYSLQFKHLLSAEAIATDFFKQALSAQHHESSEVPSLIPEPTT